MVLATTRDERAPVVAGAWLARAVRFLGSRPATLVALTVALVCVPSGERYLSTGSRITAADLGSLCLVAVAGYRALAGGRLPRSRLWVVVGAVAVAAGIATVASADPMASAAGFVRYLQVFVLLPVAVALVVRDRGDLWLVCGSVLAAAVLQGAVGVWQALTGTGASYGREDIRAVGTFGALEVMGMATVVGYGIVVALGLALVLRGRAAAALLTVAGLLAVPLLLSLSRGAAIATLCAAVVMLVVASPALAARVAVFTVAGVLAAATVLPATGGVGARLASVATLASAPDRSITDRYDLWSTAVRMWQDAPATGVGLKQFPAYRDSYAPLSLSSASDVADRDIGFQREPLLSPHNMYLLVLSEQGLLGGLALTGLLLGVGVTALRRTLRERAAGGHPGRLVSVAAVGVVGWALTSFGYGDIGGPTTVLMSVLLGLALWWAVQPAGVGTR